MRGDGLNRGRSAILLTGCVAGLLSAGPAGAAFETRPGCIGVSSHLPDHLPGAFDPRAAWSAGRSLAALHLRPFGAGSLALDAAGLALSDSTRCLRVLVSRLRAPEYAEWVGSAAVARRWRGIEVRAEASAFVTQAAPLEPGRRPESLATTSLGLAMRRDLASGLAVEGWVRDALTGPGAAILGLGRRAGARLELPLTQGCAISISGTRGGPGGEARIGLCWRGGTPLLLEHAWRSGASSAATSLGLDLPRLSAAVWSATASPGLPPSPGLAVSVRGGTRTGRLAPGASRPIDESDQDLLSLWQEGEAVAGAFDPTSLDSLRLATSRLGSARSAAATRPDATRAAREARVRRYLEQLPLDHQIDISAVPETLRADFAAAAPYLEEVTEPRVPIAPAGPISDLPASLPASAATEDLRLTLQRTHRAATGRIPRSTASASLGLGVHGAAVAAGWRGEGRSGWLRVERSGTTLFAGQGMRGLRWAEGLALRAQPLGAEAAVSPTAADGASLAARVPLIANVTVRGEVHSAGGAIGIERTRDGAVLGILVAAPEEGPTATSFTLGRSAPGSIARFEGVLARGVRPQYGASWRTARLWGRTRVAAELAARDRVRRAGAAWTEERELRASVSGRWRGGGLRGSVLSSAASGRAYVSAWVAPGAESRVDLDWTETRTARAVRRSTRDDLRLAFRRDDWTLEVARSRVGAGGSGYRGRSLAWSPSAGFAFGCVDAERAGSNSPSWLGLRQRFDRGVYLALRGEARARHWSVGLRAVSSLVAPRPARSAEARLQLILGGAARAG